MAGYSAAEDSVTHRWGTQVEMTLGECKKMAAVWYIPPVNRHLERDTMGRAALRPRVKSMLADGPLANEKREADCGNK